MRIDWTPFDIAGFEPRTELDEEGEEVEADARCIDGSDPEFYKAPWAEAEAEEGQVFACQWADGTVEIGRREDDAAVIWEPEDQGAALERLTAARRCWLHNAIEAFQKELAALGGRDG
jgi:hypothetical protein